MRYIQLQRMLHDKMVELEGLCHQEKSLLAGKLTSPARHAFTIAHARLLDWLRAQRRLLPPPQDLTRLLHPPITAAVMTSRTRSRSASHSRSLGSSSMIDRLSIPTAVSSSSSSPVPPSFLHSPTMSRKSFSSKHKSLVSSSTSVQNIHSIDSLSNRDPIYFFDNKPLSLRSSAKFFTSDKEISRSLTSPLGSESYFTWNARTSPDGSCNNHYSHKHESNNDPLYVNRICWDQLYNVGQPSSFIYPEKQRHASFGCQTYSCNYKCSDPKCSMNRSSSSAQVSSIDQETQTSISSMHSCKCDHNHINCGKNCNRTRSHRRAMSAESRGSDIPQFSPTYYQSGCEKHRTNTRNISREPLSQVLCDDINIPKSYQNCCSSHKRSLQREQVKSFDGSCVPSPTTRTFGRTYSAIDLSSAEKNRMDRVCKKNRYADSRMDPDNSHSLKKYEAAEATRYDYEMYGTADDDEDLQSSPEHKKTSIFSYCASSLPRCHSSKTTKKKSIEPKRPTKCLSLDEDKLVNSIENDDNKRPIEYGLEDNPESMSGISSHIRSSEIQMNEYFSLPFAPYNKSVQDSYSDQINNSITNLSYNHECNSENFNRHNYNDCLIIENEGRILIERSRPKSHGLNRSASLRSTGRANTESYVSSDCIKGICNHNSQMRPEKNNSRPKSAVENQKEDRLTYVINRLSRQDIPKNINPEFTYNSWKSEKSRPHSLADDLENSFETGYKKDSFSYNDKRRGSSLPRQSKDFGSSPVSTNKEWVLSFPKNNECLDWRGSRKPSSEQQSRAKQKHRHDAKQEHILRAIEHAHQQHKHKTESEYHSLWHSGCDNGSSCTDLSGRTVLSARSRSFCTDAAVTPARVAEPIPADVYRYSAAISSPRNRSDSLEARWSSDNSLEEIHVKTSKNDGKENWCSEQSSESSLYGSIVPLGERVTSTRSSHGEDHGHISDDEGSEDFDAPQRSRRISLRRKKGKSNGSTPPGK